MTGVCGSALVRAAGLPVQMWLAAADPGLFAAVRRLEVAERDYRQVAAVLAGRIGTELVPGRELSTAERRLVLGMRRGLHRGVVITAEDCRWLEKLAVRRGEASFTAELTHAERLAVDVSRLRAEAAVAIEDENQRLLGAPWELLCSDAAGRRMLADPTLAPVRDIAERLAKGEPWTSKRMRRRSEYLWRMIGRAAAKTTPRGWLGQVALASVESARASSEDPRSDELALVAVAAVEWTENVHASRAAAAAGLPDQDAWLSLAPLQRSEPGGQLQVWAIDPAAARVLRTWRMRRTAALEAITDELREGPVRMRDLCGHASADARQRATTRAFISRLAGMGVLQVSATPRRVREPWRALGPQAPDEQVTGTGFIDVYRGTAGAAALDSGRLQHAIEQLQRLRWLMRADAPHAASRLAGRLGPRPRPLLEVFAEELAAQSQRPPEPAGRHLHGAWPHPQTAGSSYARLLETIAAQASTGSPAADAACADISAAMLDALGAPQECLSWPIDATIRTSGSQLCVLDNTAPAGLLDARFIETLDWLQGPVPHAVAYREFLAELERLSGVRSVELLIPPLTGHAANAIRRPLYAGAWTGDSNPDIYSPAWQGNAEFLPLAALTLRRSGDQVLVTAGGRPLCVLYHATRTPLGPWKSLANLLLRDSPQWQVRTCPLRCSLAVVPGLDFLPRITIAGSVVISVAQWRICGDELWDRDAPELVKVRELIRLCQRRGLPRWVFVSGQPGAKPRPCDLESLRALRLLEQAAADGPPGLLLEEMLPAPPSLGLEDRSGEPGDRIAAELMIRLPNEAGMSVLAARLAASAAGAAGASSGNERWEGGE
jgi:hypothetical protein